MTGAAPVVLLMGATAVGKTAVAVALADQLPLDLVSVDSAMVYRGMDIGTGKPDAATLRRAPHQLIDLRDPEQGYSAAEFRDDATAAIERSHARGRVPLLVGGTGLYFRALCRGLAPLPAADPALRARLEEQGRRLGWPALHRRLAAVDAVSAARIHPNDPQRIQRALEVYELSGQALSTLWQQAAAEPARWPLHSLILEPCDRDWLHRRIEQRFNAMLESGLVEEVERLRARPRMHRQRPSMRAVGYRQIWAWLDGEGGRAQMAAAVLAATRQLARRQLTWLRAERDARRFDAATGIDGLRSAVAALCAAR